MKQQFPLWVKSQVVAAISQSRRVVYAGRYTRYGNRGYKTGIAGREVNWAARTYAASYGILLSTRADLEKLERQLSES